MPHDEAYRKAEQMIEEARRSGAKELDLSGMKLTELPEWLGQLTQLQSLTLSNNQLTALPESLGQLTQLQTLELSDNELTALPESLGQLTRLRRFRPYRNKLRSLPESIGNLRALDTLLLPGNNLVRLPDSFGNLRKLKCLHLGFDNVGGNQISHLPLSFLDLEKLSDLRLDDNPLNPQLAAAYENGLDAVRLYLRELAKGGRKRYEAKLLILGDGNEGKTCVSRALRGLPFKEQSTTHGVDVEQWKFPHPDYAADKEKEITLNVWDFEGQEISHQTHQFFLTSQALYLLVFKCRDQFLVDRVEYWLDTIRARAPKAKVAIVISQCEERSPHVPLDKIVAQYGDMLVEDWFFAVGCQAPQGSKHGKNIEKLQSFLKRSAADLEFMGSPWPKSYEKAEVEIKKKAKTKTAHLTRAKLNAILRKAEVSENNYDGAAGAIARIGAITQFPDSPDLGDFVVLKPQWLTKAISKVMEDGRLSNDKGEIEMRRMDAIWKRAGHRGMFPTFHNCMKEFELCYDLEDAGRCCLVPLRFGYVSPPIPWTDAHGLKERRMEYKLNIRPPMGIMSRFIVKTHHMIVKTDVHPKGIYWHNGVFLSTGGPTDPFRSEALCEFVPDERILRVRVRAAFPQNMCEQIHGYVQAVFSFFGGLTAERSYGCIKVDEQSGAETQCSGLHTEKRIYTAISKGREVMDCEFEEHEVEPTLLVGGITSFNDFVIQRLAAAIRPVVRQEMDKPPEWAEPFVRGMNGLFDWAQHNSAKLDQVLLGQTELTAEFKQESELKLHEYLNGVSEMLDDRDHTAAPGLISIMTKDRSAFNPTGWFKKTYILTPFCESEGNIHACEDGNVEFTKDKKWWAASAPWVARGTKLLAAGLQVAFAGMPLIYGTDAAKAIEAQVKMMDSLTKRIELDVPDGKEDDGSELALGKDLRGSEGETALTRAALARLLEGIAPENYRAKNWGSLRRVRMSDNSHRWLCEAHAKGSH